MQQRFLAFYWTLPVPWTGLSALPADIDAAARTSRTIAYQRRAVRATVAALGGRLDPADERAEIELAPDRGSPELAAIFAGWRDRAAACGALVAIVDFAHDNAGLWRRHAALMHEMDHPAVLRIAPSDVPGGDEFDPYAHFRAWRDRTRAHIDAKPDHRARVLAALQGSGGPLAQQARMLNALGLPTATGRDWTADNLRKFLKGGAPGAAGAP